MYRRTLFAITSASVASVAIVLRAYSNDLLPVYKDNFNSQKVKVPSIHFDRYLEDSWEQELLKRLDSLMLKHDRVTEQQIIALLNAFVYRKELRQEIMRSDGF